MKTKLNFKSIKVEDVAKGIESLPIQAVVNITADIAKKTKKKRITSGSLFFRDYCKSIASQLIKVTNHEILSKYTTAYHLNFATN